MNFIFVSAETREKTSAEMVYRKCSPRKFCRINLQLYVCNMFFSSCFFFLKKLIISADHNLENNSAAWIDAITSAHEYAKRFTPVVVYIVFILSWYIIYLFSLTMLIIEFQFFSLWHYEPAFIWAESTNHLRKSQSGINMSQHLIFFKLQT